VVIFIQYMSSGLFTGCGGAGGSGGGYKLIYMCRYIHIYRYASLCIEWLYLFHICPLHYLQAAAVRAAVEEAVAAERTAARRYPPPPWNCIQLGVTLTFVNPNG